MEFKSAQTNDPRGRHWCIFKNDQARIVCARDFNKKNIDKLLLMFNDGTIKPNFESRHIGNDAEMHLTG
jgi:hypothetical protein|tara:strand:+ start:216 stop:422 length:207 start_codon:yes stop_codon:yes gene_type:complete